MINLKENIIKYWWVPLALVFVPIIYIVGRYLKQRDKTQKYVEEWLKQ